ncbi:VENN motif pre-toxin domain-containing protein [Edwardsiella ictaluri]
MAAALTELGGGHGGDGLKAGAAGAVTASLAGPRLVRALYGKEDMDGLSPDEKRLVSNLVSVIGGIAGYTAGDTDIAMAAIGANAARVEVENNSLSLVARGCAVAAPCRTKVAEQLLEIGAKAGIAGLAGAAIKDVVDRMTSDELDHLVTLEMMGNNEITGKYLSSLQDKYGSGSESAPNMGKNLTDAEKAELGGAGSGTPGGWGPQDEENGRNKQTQSGNFDDKFKKEDLTSSANQPINNQELSAAARAWEKHAGRPGGVFDPLKGNTAQKNEAAGNFVNEVLNNKGTVRTDLSRGGVEYRLPDGRGVRYNSDGSFSGFLDPKR